MAACGKSKGLKDPGPLVPANNQEAPPKKDESEKTTPINVGKPTPDFDQPNEIREKNDYVGRTFDESSRWKIVGEDEENVHPLMAAKISCAELADCPQDVAALLIDTTERPGRSFRDPNCTGALVAPRVLLTNRHCIPEHLRKPGAKVANKIVATFAAVDGLPRETICVSRVIGITVDIPPPNGSTMSPDYAFLELDVPSTRLPFRWSKQQVTDGERVHYYSYSGKQDSTFPAARHSCEVTT